MSSSTERLHSLDALRAIMMLLGLVLHSTETYLVGNNFPFAKDENSTHIALNYLEHFIHMFRMPVFFIVAGFFAAMLFYVRGSSKMILNRARRIVLPFIVFLLILYPLSMISLQVAKTEFATGLIDLSFISVNEFIPDSTLHLWFLYYLILCIPLALGVRLLLKAVPVFKRGIFSAFTKMVSSELPRIFFVALFSFILLVLIWELSPPTPLSFTPNIASLTFYFFFFGFGWLLYLGRGTLKSFEKNTWPYIIIGIAIFTVQFIFYDQIDDILKGVMSAILMSLLISGLFGFFLRYSSEYSQRMRYVSDASYWVYLVHIPFTIIIPVFMAGWDISGIIKFMITLTATTIICFSSYHLFVRRTFLGVFLNGRRYP